MEGGQVVKGQGGENSAKEEFFAEVANINFSSHHSSSFPSLGNQRADEDNAHGGSMRNEEIYGA